MNDTVQASRKRHLLILGLIGLIIIWLFCMWMHTAVIQGGIAGATSKALLDDGINAGSVSVDGRDVTLRGFVGSEDIRKRAGEVAAGVGGVRNVNNLLAVQQVLHTRPVDPSQHPVGEPPQFRIDLSGPKAMLTGDMPDQNTIDKALAATGTVVDPGSIHSTLETDMDISNPHWAIPVAELATKMKGVENGAIDVDGLVLTLTGAVESNARRDEIGAKAVAAADGRLRVDNQLIVPSMMAAANLQVEINSRLVSLNGTVPDRQTYDLAESMAKSTFGANNVTNRLVIDPAAKQADWLPAAIGLAPKLKGIDPGSLRAGNGGLTLIGTVGSEALRDSIGAAAMAAVPNLKVDNQLLVRAPLKVAAAPAAAPEPAPAPPPPSIPPTLNIDVNDNGVATLEGTLPNQAAVEQTVAAAVNSFGKGNVRDRLTIDDTVTSPAWLGRAIGLGAQLSGLRSGALMASESGVSLTGSVGNTGLRGELNDATEATGGGELKANSQIKVIPSVPPNVRMGISNGRAVLSGSVGNQRTADQAVLQARKLVDPANIDNQLLVSDDVTSPAWIDAAVGLGSQLKGIDPASLSASSSSLVLTGTVDSHSKRSNIGASAISAMAQAVPVDNRIAVVLPKTTPPRVKIAATDSGVTLAGLMPDKPSINAAIDIAGSAFGKDNVQNLMSSGETVANPDWLTGAINLGPKIQGIKGGSLEAGDGVLTLRGTVASEKQKSDLGAQAAAAVSPALRVDNQLVVVVPRNKTPTVRMDIKDQRVTLTGMMPDQGAINMAGDKAGQTFGKDKVDNRLAMAADITNPKWLSGAIGFGQQLRGIDPASMEAADGVLTITGTVPSEAIKSQLGAQALAAVTPDLRVNNQLVVVVPRTTPPTLVMEVNDSAVALSGQMPDQGSIDLAATTAKRAFNAQNVSNNLTIGDTTANPDWLAAAIKFAPEMGGVDPGLIEAGNGRLTLKGTVESHSRRTDIGNAARAAVGSSLTVDNQLIVKLARTIPPNVKMDVNGTQVTLSGLMPSRDAIDIAAATASETFGTDNVRNLMSVGETITNPGWLSAAIKLAPQLSGIDPSSLEAGNGFLTLRGTVANSRIRERIGRQALAAVSPDLRVDNQLQVAPSTLVAERLKALDFTGITFEYDSARITDEGKVILDEAFDVLNVYTDVALEVAGHTDSTGRAAYNQKLSQQRAESVIAYLAGRGLAANRFTPKGYGETQPVNSNSTREGRARNRRIEFRIAEE